MFFEPWRIWKWLENIRMHICQPIASKIQMCQWYQTRKAGDSDKCNIISFQIQCDQIFHVAKEPIRDRRKLIGRKVKACYFLYSNKTIWFKNTYRAQNFFLDSQRTFFKLMLARWRSQLIKYRVRERQPITERRQSISLKFHLSYA